MSNEEKANKYLKEELNVKHLVAKNDPWVVDGTDQNQVSSEGNSFETSFSPTIDFVEDSLNISSTESNVVKEVDFKFEKSVLNTVSSTQLFPNNSANQKDEKNFLLAACYVEDAIKGRTLKYNTDESSLIYYQEYSVRPLKWLTVFALWFLLLIALFEKPSVSGLEIPYWGTILMEVACLVIVTFRIYQLWKFVPRKVFLFDTKNIIICVCLVITVIDMLVYISMTESGILGIRISRVFRPLFLINMNESKQIRRAFRNIRNTVVDILNVLVLFVFSMALFSLLAFKLFQKRNLHYSDGRSYFTNYLECFFDLYILVTTANSPDVMMPAYDLSNWFSIFFIIYTIVNTYIFMNLFLAVIYNSYRTHLKSEIRSAIFWKRKKLALAFDLLKDFDEKFPEKYYISYKTWEKLMNKVNSKLSHLKIILYWEVLKTKMATSDGNLNLTSLTEGLGKTKFTQVYNLLNISVTENKPKRNFFYDCMPTFYKSKYSKYVKNIVEHWAFIRFFDFLIIANAICIALDFEVTEWFFLAIFMIEIFLRVYVVGPRSYFMLENKWNWFDFIIILSAFLATVSETIVTELNDVSAEAFPQEVLDFLMVIRCLRLMKIVVNYKQFSVIIKTIVNILPSMLTYGAVLLCVYYIFAILGMELFSGLITHKGTGDEMDQICNNLKLNNSEFARDRYCSNNFNDLLHSFVILIELTVVNQWHVITSGYSLVTTKWARIYFVAFHVIVVILIMNIIVAFVLEAFILEYSISKSPMQTYLEKTISKLGLAASENENSRYTHDKTQLINKSKDEDNDDEDEEEEENMFAEEYVEKANRKKPSKSKLFFKLKEGK